MGIEPVLALESLQVRYPGGSGETTVVRDVSLTVAPGECLGVVGESGAGKSQTFLAALGLLPAAARVSGSVRLEGHSLSGEGRSVLDRVRGSRVGMVFQNPSSSLTPHLGIADQIAETIVRHRGGSWRDARARARQLLERVRIDDPSGRSRQYPHELSGGMRQRVMIAIALSCAPALLIADEPTTALDVTVQAQILALLADLQREQGMAVVLISHDFGVVAGLAHRVAVMQSGRVVELAPADQIFSTPQHPHTRALLAAARRPQSEPATVEQSAAREPEQHNDASGVLQLQRLTVDYHRSGYSGRGRTLRAVDAVSLDLAPGEVLGLVGESGSGKSTLVRAVLQLVHPTGGAVVFCGRALQELSRRQLRTLRGQLQVVFQDPLGSLDPRLTVEETVSEPLVLNCPEMDSAARAHAVSQLLAKVGLPPDAAGRLPHELSGGQCQRVGIARAMILAPRLLICDEPLSALDASLQLQMVALLAALQRESGTAILFVSHDLSVVQRLCRRVLVLYRGRAMELAPASELYERPLHPYTRELLDSIPVADPRVQPLRLRGIAARTPAGAVGESLSGCLFAARCPHSRPICVQRQPEWEQATDGRHIACHRWRELSSGTE